MLTLLGVIAAIAILYVPITYLQAGFLRRSAMIQAHQLADDGQAGKALTILGNVLETWPDDLEALALEGQLLAKHASAGDEVVHGVNVLEHLLRLDPDTKDRQEDRKRLVQLLIRMGDMVQAGSVSVPHMGKNESRYRAANKIADQMLAKGADDAEAYRLLGTTLERLALVGEPGAMASAIKAYQKALRRDPGDVASAERLAALRLEKSKDQAGADRILEDLIKARPRSVEGRLARARHFLATNREERARADLDAASRLAPTDPGVRVMGASLAVRKGDVAAARRHLDALPEADKRNPRLSVLLGEIEMADHRPDEAIKQLRHGLVRTSGTDIELTWQLAYTLIKLGRAPEARPLVAQYQRLKGRGGDAMLKFLEGMQKERSGRRAGALLDLESIREEVAADRRAELEMMVGRCRETSGDPKLAETAYLKARDLAPSWTTPRLALARLLSKSDPDRAVAELEEGLRVLRGEPSLVAELARLRIIRQMALPADRRDWSTVESALNRDRKAGPVDPELVAVLVQYQLARGLRAEALAKLEEVTKGAGRARSDLWLTRASVLSSLGRDDEALRVLEEAGDSGAAGDLASLRVARSNRLLRSGRGRQAIEVLRRGAETLPVVERVALAKARVDLLIELGDRPGARASCAEWAELAPDEHGPGLKLIDMSRRGGGPDEFELGMELLRKSGGEDEPEALIAQAMGILQPGKAEAEIDASRLDQAEALSLHLQDVAPNLPATAMVKALLLERTHSYEEAIEEYKTAIKRDPSGGALARLVDLLTRLKRPEDLARLRSEASDGVRIDRLSVASAYESGDKEQAEAILERLIDSQPESLEYRVELARMLGQMGKPEEAEATLRGLIERQADRPQAWLTLLSSQVTRGDKAGASATIARIKVAYKGDRPDLLLARCLWISGDKAAAAQAYDEALAKNPDDLAAIRAASLLHGVDARAEALLRRALAINPKASWASQRLAMLLATRPGAPSWAEAWSLVDPSVAGRIDSPLSRWARSIVLLSAPDPARRVEAIPVLSSLTEDLPPTDPLAYQARFRLAQLLLASNDAAGAAKAIAPATAEPSAIEPSSLALAIEALSRAGRTEEARVRLDRLAESEPDSVRTICCRAAVLKAEGNVEDAASTLEGAAVAAESKPDGDRESVFYFDQLARLGLEEAAERLGRKIADRWPKQAVALAAFLASRDRVDEALAACRVAANAGSTREVFRVLYGLGFREGLDPSAISKVGELALSITEKALPGDALFVEAGTLMHHLGRPEDEVRFCRKALEADPSNVPARNNLAWSLIEILNRPAEGLVEIDLTIRQAGYSPPLGDTRGVALMKLGRIDEAIAELERVNHDHPTAIRLLHLSRAYTAKGRTDDARQTFERARKAGGDRRNLEPKDLAELTAANP